MEGETMIITFMAFQNFYSFKNKAQMNFMVNDNVPQTIILANVKIIVDFLKFQLFLEVMLRGNQS